MDVTLNISPEAITILRQRAKVSGQDWPVLASGLLEDAVFKGTPQNELWQHVMMLPKSRAIADRTPSQRIAALETLIAGAVQAPSIADEALSSEGLYD